MRHPTDGMLRRLLDEPAGVADADREHVAGCPQCLAGLAAAREDAALVGAALATSTSRRATSTRRGGACRRGRATRARRAAAPAPRRPAGGGRRCAARSSRRVAVAVAPGRRRRRGRQRLAADLPDRADRPGQPHRRPTSSRCPTCRAYGDVEVTGEPDVHAGRRRGRGRGGHRSRRARGARAAPRGDRRAGLPGRRPGAARMFTFSAEQGRRRPPPRPARRCRRRRRGWTAASSGWSPGPGVAAVWSASAGAAGPGRGPRGRADGVLLGRPVRDGARLPAVAARPARRRRGAAAHASPRTASTLPLPVPADAGDELHRRRRRRAGHGAHARGTARWRPWSGWTTAW